MANINNILRTISYKNLDKWYVEYYLNAVFLDSKYSMDKISSLITPIKRRIKKNDYDGKLPVVSKIVFKTGQIVFRQENKTGMDLLHVKKGDLLISSINFHQGAVAYNNLSDFVCSTHYQTFEINTSKVIPEYLVMVLRSSIFISMVSGIKANGIKNESGYDFIGGFDIPVPTIEEQKNILVQYHSIMNEAEENVNRGDRYTMGLYSDIQSMVSDFKEDMSQKKTGTSLIQTVSFSAANRWQVDYILKEGILEKIYDSYKYESTPISKLQTQFLFGLSLKASTSPKAGMIPMLRMPNIVNGEIDCTELKYLPKESVFTPKDPTKYLLKKGDFLINRTNSKELVGKSAVFNLEGEYTYASYVIRYRFDTSVVLPEYVNIMFMLPIVRKQIDVMSRQTAGQCNINSEEIGAIEIPVPTIKIQKEIIKKYNDAKAGANVFYKQADSLRKKASENFEKEIFS